MFTKIMENALELNVHALIQFPLHLGLYSWGVHVQKPTNAKSKVTLHLAFVGFELGVAGHLP
jgi:hypothetical protein